MLKAWTFLGRTKHKSTSAGLHSSSFAPMSSRLKRKPGITCIAALFNLPGDIYARYPALSWNLVAGCSSRLCLYSFCFPGSRMSDVGKKERLSGSGKHKAYRMQYVTTILHLVVVCNHLSTF